MSITRLREDIKFNNWISWIAIFFSLSAGIFVPNIIQMIKDRNEVINKNISLIEHQEQKLSEYKSQEPRIDLLSEVICRYSLSK